MDKNKNKSIRTRDWPLNGSSSWGQWEVMEDWRQKKCQHQERRSKERNKTKSGYINSLPLQTQLCSCEPRHKRRIVLFMSSRPCFLHLSCASSHMISAHSDARQTAEVRMVNSRPVAGTLLHSNVRRTWEVGWDRTSTWILCRREDLCLGLFVFSVLSSIPILPHSPDPAALPPAFLSPEIVLPLSCVAGVFYLLCANAVQSCPASIFLP